MTGALLPPPLPPSEPPNEGVSDKGFARGTPVAAPGVWICGLMIGRAVKLSICI